MPKKQCLEAVFLLELGAKVQYLYFTKSLLMNGFSGFVQRVQLYLLDQWRIKLSIFVKSIENDK